MRIADLARRTGVSRDALRYYERRGLLGTVGRAGNNYRHYGEATVREVDMLLQLKALGFSLAEIADLLGALRSNRIDCAQGAALMRRKRLLLEQRIQDMKKMGALLKQEEARLAESARQSAPGA